MPTTTTRKVTKSPKVLIAKTFTDNAGTSHTLAITKFNHSEFASEETNCYQATLLVDGTLQIESSNRGHGGPDNIDAINPDDRGSMEDIDSWFRSLPNRPSKYFAEGSSMDLEAAINELVEELLIQRETSKHTKRVLKAVQTKTLVRDSSHKAGEYQEWNRAYTGADRLTLRLKIMKNDPTSSILNELLEQNPDTDIIAWMGVEKP